MKKLPNQYLSGPNLDPYNKILVESLIECLIRDDSCNATWQQLFNRCPKQSATVIEHIGNFHNYILILKLIEEEVGRGAVAQSVTVNVVVDSISTVGN